MNLKTWIPLLAAIVLGLVAAKIGRDILSNRGDSANHTGELAPIVVAKGALSPGQELTADNLAVSRISTEAGTTGFADPQQLTGRVVLGEVSQGQPLYESMLAPVGAGSGLQALVPPGMRAITVEVNEFSGVAGLLVPGCLVDVMTTIDDGEESIARTIVESVRVTAVGRRTSKADEAVETAAGTTEMFRSVTLVCAPKEAEAIELAATKGRPRLVLRSNTDDEPTDSEGVTLAELVGRSLSADRDPFVPVVETPVASAPATQPVTPQVSIETPIRTPKRSITIIRGGVESDVTVEVRRPRTTNGLMTGYDVSPIAN